MRIPKHIGETDRGRKIQLHEDAVTQGFGILGKRGKGKSNLLGVMLEIIAKRGQKFVVLDPPDAHWGIRFTQNSKGQITGSSGVEALIIGGEHGDIPIEHTDGKETAHIVVEGNISAVIEMKAMTFTARQKWCADFAEELFRINQTPRFIAFEEAHNFLPQVLKFDEQKRVLYAMGRLIEEGRGLGLGFALASQRPAKVNKDVLEQVDNMFALGMIGPRDIEQVKDWFKYHIGDKERLKEVIEKLVKMKPGEAWFLSPEWQSEITKFNIRLRTTYHAGRTPKPGEKPIRVSRFTVTQAVKRLRKMFVSKQSERKKEITDLKDAKSEIRQLESNLRSRPAETKEVKVVDQKAVDRAVRETEKKFGPLRGVLEEAMKVMVKVNAAGFEGTAIEPQQIEQALKDTAQEITRLAKLNLKGREKEFQSLKSDVNRMLAKMKRVLSKEGLSVEVDIQHHEPVSVHVRETAPAHYPEIVHSNGEKVRAGAERMLAALVQWSPKGMSEGQMRSHAGMKKSGTFGTYKGDLLRNGYMVKNGGLLFATQVGMDYFGHDLPQAPQTTEDVLAVWKPRLRGGACRMLDVLVEAGGSPVAKEELATNSGMTKSGTFGTYLGDLRRAHLIEVNGTQVNAHKENLFL